MGQGKSPTDAERQRHPVQQPIITWVVEHPGSTFTLNDLVNALGSNRASTSSTINRLIAEKVLPGLSSPAKGVYRYDPSFGAAAFAPKAPKAEVAAVETPAPTTSSKRKFTEVGMVGRSAVVIVDADGNLWRAERLK
jgi:hypothetical protein